MAGFCLLAACWMLVASTLCRAEAPERQVDFDIPAQPLAAALDRYGTATGLAVLVDRELTRGRRSAPLRGRYGLRQGLERLLAGTGLMALHTGNEGVTLAPARLASTTVSRTAQAPRGVGSFARVLQTALGRALCTEPLTRPGHYRAALQLWIGRGGRVEHSRLLASTGDLIRDAALVERLRDMRTDRAPPSSLPQPITVLVVPESVAGMECETWMNAAGT